MADAMAGLDEMKRADALDGLGLDLEKPLALVRRYEAACVARMERARKQIGKGRPSGISRTTPTPRPVEPAPLPSPTPPAAVPKPASFPTACPPSFSPIVKTARVGNRRERRALKAMARRG